MDTLAGQFQLFKTNFDSFLTDIMWPSLDTLKRVFHCLADDAHSLQSWVHSHRDEANSYIKTAAVAVGIAMVNIGTAGWRIVSGIAGVPSSIDRVSAAIDRLRAASAITGPKIATAAIGATAIPAGSSVVRLAGQTG